MALHDLCIQYIRMYIGTQYIVVQDLDNVYSLGIVLRSAILPVHPNTVPHLYTYMCCHNYNNYSTMTSWVQHCCWTNSILSLHVIASSEGRSFECMFGNVTIYLADDRMCNGQADCPDGSDEDTDCGTYVPSSVVCMFLWVTTYIAFVRRWHMSACCCHSICNPQ